MEFPLSDHDFLLHLYEELYDKDIKPHKAIIDKVKHVDGSYARITFWDRKGQRLVKLRGFKAEDFSEREFERDCEIVFD